MLSPAIWSPVQAVPRPLSYALLSPGLSPNLRRWHRSAECCIQKNWPGYYHTGSQSSLCSHEQAADSGLTLKERQKNLV